MSPKSRSQHQYEMNTLHWYCQQFLNFGDRMLVTDFVSHIVAHIMTSLKLHNLCSIMKNKVPTQLRVVLIMDNPYWCHVKVNWLFRGVSGHCRDNSGSVIPLDMSFVFGNYVGWNLESANKMILNKPKTLQFLFWL